MASPTLREQAYARILAMIENGDIPKGGVTSEVGLALKLDMSRTPVRAALQQLELEGFVRIVSKHGVLILDSSSQRVGDLLDIMASLALFSISTAYLSDSKELQNISLDMAEAFHTLRNANPIDPNALIAFEHALLNRFVLLSNNNEMAKSFQSSASRLFWSQNTRRWHAPYDSQTSKKVEALIHAVGLDFNDFRLALFDYVRLVKLTWQ